MRLSIKQTQALDVLEDKQTTELVFGGGAGGGKSGLGCYWMAKSSLKYPETRYVIGRNSLKTLKETTLNTLWWVFKEQGIKPSFHYKYNEVKGIFFFKNGSEIMLKDLGYYPSDPNYDELGSLEITAAFVDECNQIRLKGWQVLKSRIRHNLDEYGLIPKILGSCNPSKGWVYTEFFAPHRNKTLPDNRAFIQSLLTDNPYITKHYKDNLLSLDRASKERLLYGNWDYSDDPTVLCDYDAICDMFTNDFVKPTGKKYISADMATRGRDRFIVSVRDGLVIDFTKGADKEKSTAKENEQTLRDISAINNVPRSQIVADSDGLGDYLESYLTGIKEFKGGSTAVDKKTYFNLKSECAFKLAELINKREIKVICSEEQKERIIEEVGVLKEMSVDDDEKRKRIIGKDEMKELLGRSPDYLDDLIMHMYFEIAKKGITLILQ